MSAVLTWIVLNPKSFGTFLVAFLGMLFKLALQLSGESSKLAAWNDAASQAVDIAVYLLMGYGVIMGSVHASRGPALTSADQAAVIVAALAPAPVPLAVEQVNTIAAEVAMKSPPAETVVTTHRF
jgi:hypothetical protein